MGLLVTTLMQLLFDLESLPRWLVDVLNKNKPMHAIIDYFALLIILTKITKHQLLNNQFYMMF
jgi:hypothetical protein